MNTLKFSKALRLVIFSIFLVSANKSSFSQDTLIILHYPSEKEITVILEAVVAPFREGFNYQYKLSSLATSLQNVGHLSVVPTAGAESLKAPLGWDVKIAPVPFARISWGSSDSTFDIFPGNTLTGFKYFSKGIPSIRDFYAMGWIEPPTVEIEPDSIIGGVFPDNSFHGFTIAPSNPPVPLVAISFLDTLISYKHQAAALSWLKDKREDKKDEDDEDKDDTIVRTLDKRLEKIRKELVKGDSVKAREELQKFVKKVEELYKESVEAEKEKEEKEKVVMTSEAYALLKFNAEYLIDRLPKKKKGDDD